VCLPDENAFNEWLRIILDASIEESQSQKIEQVEKTNENLDTVEDWKPSESTQSADNNLTDCSVAKLIKEADVKKYYENNIEGFHAQEKWILNDVDCNYNVYVDKKECIANIERHEIFSEFSKLKALVEERYTWIYNSMCIMGILTAIWVQTDRFSVFWKGPWIQKFLFRNPMPEEVNFGMGPHPEESLYLDMDMYAQSLENWNVFADIKVAYLASWVPTIHQ